MFGYIKIQKLDLLVRDFFSYKTAYCYLCHRLGKNYGLLSRRFLSNDLTFLMLCMDELEESAEEVTYRCPFNPLKKMNCRISQKAADFAAFLNYYLVIQKCKDNYADEKKWIYKAIGRAFERKKNYREQCQKYETGLKKAEAYFHALDESEHNETASFDTRTNAMGTYFASLFDLFLQQAKDETGEMQRCIHDLGFYLGKWIYLMDAYEDYQKDSKRGQFNLLGDLFRQDESEQQLETHKRVFAIHQMLLFQMNMASNKVNWKKHGRIIQNVLSKGCHAEYQRIVQKNYPMIEQLLQRTGEN